MINTAKIVYNPDLTNLYYTAKIVYNPDLTNLYYTEPIIYFLGRSMKASKLISLIPIFTGIIIITLSIIDYIVNDEWTHWYATVFGIILIIVGITNFYRKNK